MANTTLFCEGKGTSLDYVIFSKLLQIVSNPSSITLVPLGGKFNSTAFVDGYIQRGGVVAIDKAFFLRDRDFDFPIPEIPSLISVAERKGINRNVFIYASYRTTVENYLINSNLLHEFIERSSPLSLVNVTQIVTEAAQTIVHYSAVRHALGKIRKPVALGTTWIVEGSGHLPNSPILQSLDQCMDKAEELINRFAQDADMISTNEFRRFADEFSQRFADRLFWENGEFLVWFHGKDLQKAITNQFINQGVRFSWTNYYRFAIDKIDFFQFTDYKSFIDALNESTTL